MFYDVSLKNSCRRFLDLITAALNCLLTLTTSTNAPRLGRINPLGNSLPAALLLAGSDSAEF
jgi:hypothetical protein